MKQYFLKQFLVAGVLLLTVPVSLFAQKEKKERKEIEEKVIVKEKGEVETIVITRTGDTKEKTVVEINGNQIKVNGKNVDELADADVRVHRSKVRDPRALVPAAPPVAGHWNFNLDMDHDRALALFEADTNRAMLGVVTDEDEKGAKITSVSKGSAAEKAGLKAGDIIAKINGEEIDDAGDVSREVRKQKPGDKIDLTIIRDGKEQKISAELGQWKGVRVNAGNFRMLTPDHVRPFERNEEFDVRIMGALGGAPKLGMSVQDDEDGKGVKVLEVEEESNAAKAGIRENDLITHINDKAIKNVDEIRSEIRQNREKASMNFKVLRNGKTQSIEVKVPRKLKTADL